MLRFAFLFLIGVLLHGVSVRAQGIRDNDLAETRLFQTLPVVTAGFPKGIDGRPDWVQALNKGLIAPRSTKTGEARPPEVNIPMPKDGIVFSNTQFMPFVVFPHQPHAEWLSCMNCHDTLFEFSRTGRGKGMTAIFQGEHCGACHGRVAFSPEGSCYRCHSMPNPAAQKQNSPFVAPAKVEKAPEADEDDKPRRRKKSTFTAGRLAPSVVPPPSAEPPPVTAPLLD